MEAEAVHVDEAVEDAGQAVAAQKSMDDTTADTDHPAADITPPEPEQDVGWADDEEDEKWSVLLDRTKYRFVKRTPLRPPTQQHDIYITTSRQRNVLLRRAQRLLIDERLPAITLHGLGAAIPLAVELALQITGDMPTTSSPTRLTDDMVRAANADSTDATSPSTQPAASSLPASVLSLSPFASSLFTVSIRTGTEVLIDDYLPLLPGLPPVAQQRHNSSIHITLALKPHAATALLTAAPTTATAATAAAARHGRPDQHAVAGAGGRGGRGGGGGDRGRGRGRGGGGGGGGDGGRGRGGGKHGYGGQQSSQPAKRQKQ